MSVPSPQWLVMLEGTPSDLAYLARYFQTPDLTVFQDERDGRFLLSSDGFAAFNSPEAVTARAQERLVVLSGALQITRQSPIAARAVGVFELYADGRRVHHVTLTASVHVRVEAEAEIMTRDADGKILHRQTPPPRIVLIDALARTDESVAKAMRLLVADDAKNWVGLYRLHEVIEADVGGEHSMRKHGWTTESELKRFKHSANSVTVAGDSARHGKEVQHPPARPMTLGEAAAYVNYVMHVWLAAKGV